VKKIWLKIILSLVIVFNSAIIFSENSVAYDLVITEKTIGINASAQIENVYEILGKIRDGIPYTLIYNLELFEKKTGLFSANNSLLIKNIKREISYEDFDSKYIVKEGNNKFYFTNSKSLLEYILNYKDGNLANNLDDNKTYIIKVRLRGESIKLVYPPMSIVMELFDITYNFKTGWSAKEFEIQ
jgi:hypothetical protein